MKNLKLNPFFGLSALALALSACGPQAYVPSTIQSNENAAGNMFIPPKVDIILGVSQDGTMANIYPAIQTEIYNFTRTLEAKNWDYRFIAISLSEYQPATDSLNFRASTSHYDGNYYIPNQPNSWLAPYPGADPANLSLSILPTLFSPNFIIPSRDIDPNHNNAHEAGLKNQLTFIQRSDVQQNFLRPDAQLAFITLSTGDDHSSSVTSAAQNCNSGAPAGEQYGYWKQRSNGTNCIADADYYSVSSKNTTFKTGVSLIKSPSLVKYYSVVAMPSNGGTTCGGSAIRRGYDYSTVSNSFGGKTIDLCSTPVSTALAQISSDLTTNTAIYRKHYLVLSSQPDQSTIVVKKVSSGVSQTVANDSANGWSYEGYQTVMPIDEFKLQSDQIWRPYTGATKTGYVIKLNGSSALVGDDTATVQYMNSGGQVVAQ